MISEDGFLSPSIARWRMVHEKRNAGWFSFARELNQLAHLMQKAIVTPPPSEKNVIFLARLLFLKCLTSYQAAIVLATHGLTSDAQAVLRSGFESLFCLGACKSDPDIIEKLSAADIRHKKTVGRELLGFPDGLKLGEQAESKIKKFLDLHPEKGNWLDVSKLAKSAELAEAYSVYYRSLSYDAAHVTASSLQRFFEAVGNEVDLKYGPDVLDVGTTLAYSCVLGLYLLKIATDVFTAPTIDERLLALWPKYKALLAETYPEKSGD